MECTSELSTWMTVEGGIYSLAPILLCSRVAPELEFTQASRWPIYERCGVREVLGQKGRADWYRGEEQQEELLGIHVQPQRALCLV